MPSENKLGEEVELPPLADIPVIDLSKAKGTQNERRELVDQLMKAGQEYGFVQVN